MPARYKHDCDSCIFMGQVGEYDTYFCPLGPGFHSPGTLIARESGLESDYLSRSLDLEAIVAVRPNSQDVFDQMITRLVRQRVIKLVTDQSKLDTLRE